MRKLKYWIAMRAFDLWMAWGDSPLSGQPTDERSAEALAQFPTTATCKCPGLFTQTRDPSHLPGCPYKVTYGSASSKRMVDGMFRR